MSKRLRCPASSATSSEYRLSSLKEPYFSGLALVSTAVSSTGGVPSGVLWISDWQPPSSSVTVSSARDLFIEEESRP